MKVSIITVSYNSAKTLQDTIDSVGNQTYPNIEYIIVDGKSNDGTVEIIKKNNCTVSKWISERDKGLYDAMNKGIKMATGDIVGIINSDDFYSSSQSISAIVDAFKGHEVECVFADVEFVRPSNLNKTIRYYSSRNFAPWKFRFGYMPAHPTFFTFRKNFEKYDYYKTYYKIAADFELLTRFLLINKLSYHYIPMSIIKMRTGGVSTASLDSKIVINKESLIALRENGVRSNYLFLYSRYLTKVFSFFPQVKKMYSGKKN
ncbi:glycosyltransferase [Echinicola sp. CAU 1574]|uniref:Glycosyltransferase n=1 Tax=Echinicola arenosa TaxID=2774144 RepID=A0ABR9AMQ5_9BACT|nr:glycosyltransferase family 2 protein [Echinicola arenosa]MBD8490081.1 glycosyltransferase [Echinicola arenosa]